MPSLARVFEGLSRLKISFSAVCHQIVALSSQALQELTSQINNTSKRFIIPFTQFLPVLGVLSFVTM